MTSIRAKHAVALVLPALMLAVAGMPAKAQPAYDKKIAKATADIVSQKLGEIRGSFGIDDEPVMLPDLMRTYSLPGQSVRRIRPDRAPAAAVIERHLRASDLDDVRVILAGLN